MPDDNQDAQDNSVDTQDAGQDQGENLQDDQSSDSGEEQKFTKTQLQQISSMMGSIIKKKIDENVIPLIENSSTAVHPSPDIMSDTSPAVKKFNEELLDQILSGDVTGAFERYNKLQKQADQSLSQTRQTQLNKATESYSDQPYFGEVKEDMANHATEAIKKGYPPAAAAEHGYNVAVRALLQKKISGDIDGGALHLESGGRYTAPVKTTGKLPPNFEEAYQRDKAKGLFKDRKEFIANLAPQIRAQFNL